MLPLLPETVCADTVSVAVEGLSDELRDNVLANLAIYQEREEDLAAARIRGLHAQAPSQIRAALQPFGFYRARIEAALEQADGEWTARYQVDPGESVRLDVVDVRLTGEGAGDPEIRKLVDPFPLKHGEPVNHAIYEQAKRAIQRSANERGYFDLNLTRHEIVVDLEAYRAELYLHVDSGRRYRFGEIHLLQEQEIIDPALLARYVRLQPGDPYSTAALLDLQSALSASEFFSDVEVIVNPEQAQDHTIPVEVRMTPRKPSKYTFGIGYGTDTGPRGQVGWERRYINRQGHHARAQLRASEIESSLSASYLVPIRNPRTDQFEYFANYADGRILAIDSTVRRLGIRRTVARGHLQESLSLTRQSEKFSIGPETGSSALLLPGVTWSYTWGEERIYTRAGARVVLDLRGASEQFASDTSLFQTRLQPKLILPVSDFGRVIARADIGDTQIMDFGLLPPSLRFFAGGDVSVRGYKYNSLGPTNAQGDVIGGKNLLVGSVEYEHRLTGSWAGAVFYDIGNALNDFNDRLKEGAGIGVRWRSPVGQIRVDIASAISEPGRPWRLHLNIGPDL